MDLFPNASSEVSSGCDRSKTPNQAPSSTNRNSSSQRCRTLAYNVVYQLRTLWLFIFSDLKTIIIPKTIFGCLNAVSAAAFAIEPYQPRVVIFKRTPFVLVWVLINLLPFAIDNQRQPSSMLEDRANKPWRPMPSGRLTTTQTRKVMWVLYVAAGYYSLHAGGIRQSLFLMLLGYWYNDLGGADVGWMSRNFINACGFVSYSMGAMEVALATRLQFTPPLLSWALILAAIVFSTVHTQDMADQVGDRLRHRVTLPLAIGDRRARYMTAFWMVFWVCVGPHYWQLSFLPWATYAMLGLTIAMRTIALRCIKSDQLTFLLWNIWMVLSYALPFIHLLESSYFQSSTRL
ncbi:MAG: hypothetical protein M1820_006055 [Bogoriella megaspora]|nr:MAG: hypothetical protein M1820_006055 [Bogoriella megaspora]